MIEPDEDDEEILTKGISSKTVLKTIFVVLLVILGAMFIYIGIFPDTMTNFMIGFTLIGVAMLSSQDYSKGLGWMTVVLGAAGVVASFLQMVDPASYIGVVPFFAYIIYYFVLGRKIYSLSKAV